MYCSVDDLARLLGASRLLELADDSGRLGLDAPEVRAVLEEHIEQADREIDSHVAAVEPVPLAAPVPPLAANLSAKLAVYNLHRRRPHLELGEWGKEYERCLRLLERIATGKVALRATEAAPELSTGAGVSVKTSGGPRFGERLWEEY